MKTSTGGQWRVYICQRMQYRATDKQAAFVDPLASAISSGFDTKVLPLPIPTFRATIPISPPARRSPTQTRDEPYRATKRTLYSLLSLFSPIRPLPSSPATSPNAGWHTHSHTDLASWLLPRRTVVLELSTNCLSYLFITPPLQRHSLDTKPAARGERLFVSIRCLHHNQK